MRTVLIALSVLALTPSATVFAQTKKPSTPARTAPAVLDEATALTNGWALLAQGLNQEASQRASEILRQYPRSAAALSFAVDAAIARGGAALGLTEYERWLGTRTVEEPFVVRRIATAVLRDVAAQKTNSVSRLEALKALAEDGQQDALTALEGSSNAATERTLAELGNANAVSDLAKELAAGNPDKARIVESLGRSNRRSAVTAVVTQARDQRDEVRAAVADALSELHADDQVGLLKSLLTDTSAFVRFHAARALYRLGDPSGAPLLQELATGDTSASRLAALEAMAPAPGSAPDATWLALARDLTSATEPEIRVQAARLLGPYDSDLARRVLESAADDPNISIREIANRALPDALVASDFAGLRRLLRSADEGSRVRAADRILKLTY